MKINGLNPHPFLNLVSWITRFEPQTFVLRIHGLLICIRLWSNQSVSEELTPNVNSYWCQTKKHYKYLLFWVGL